MSPLIDVSDIPNYLNARIPEAQAQLLAAMASDVVRNYVGWRIDRGAADVLAAEWDSPAVLLPTLKLNDVASVSIDGQPIDPATYRFSANGVLRWAVPMAPQAVVEATVDHGYDEVPLEVQAVVLASVARVIVNPQGLRSMTTGSYSETYPIPNSGEPAGLTLSAAEKRILDRYRTFP